MSGATVSFKALVKDLSKRYDRVIIDSAPLNVVSDSLLLATLGEITTERSGVMNLGLEGLMSAGAVTAFIVGIAFTVLVQSSSVTTSLIVPLVGAVGPLVHHRHAVRLVGHRAQQLHGVAAVVERKSRAAGVVLLLNQYLLQAYRRAGRPSVPA